MRLIRRVVPYLAALLFGFGVARAEVTQAFTLTVGWGGSNITAGNGLPAVLLDGGVPLIDAGVKFQDGGPSCIISGYIWVDAGGPYFDAVMLWTDGGPWDAGYFCDGGINDGGLIFGPGWYGSPADAGYFCDAGTVVADAGFCTSDTQTFTNYNDGGFDAGCFADGGSHADAGYCLDQGYRICQNCYALGYGPNQVIGITDAGGICFQKTNPSQDGGPQVDDGGPVVRVDAGVIQSCSGYVNLDGGVIVADGGPWLQTNWVNVGNRTNLSVVCTASGADPTPAGELFLQGSNDTIVPVLIPTSPQFVPFDAGSAGSYWWYLTNQSFPFVRVVVQNANDAGVLQCTVYASGVTN